MYGVKYGEERDASRIFFIDILARRLLLLGCVNWFKQCYASEAAVYDALVAADNLVVDGWSGIEFGNIEEGDQVPP